MHADVERYAIRFSYRCEYLRRDSLGLIDVYSFSTHCLLMNTRAHSSTLCCRCVHFNSHAHYVQQPRSFKRRPRTTAARSRLWCSSRTTCPTLARTLFKLSPPVRLPPHPTSCLLHYRFVGNVRLLYLLTLCESACFSVTVTCILVPV